MKKTEGYVTADGTFFENEKEAELYEAEWRLRNRLASEHPELNQERFLAIVLNMMVEIGGYVDAYKAADTVKRVEAEDEIGAEADAGEPAKAVDGLGFVSSAEEDLASLLKLPPRGPVDVPNVGRRSRTKKVPDGREKHGA